VNDGDDRLDALPAQLNGGCVDGLRFTGEAQARDTGWLTMRACGG